MSIDQAVVADVRPPDNPVLSAPLNLKFDYTRSLGPVPARFAAGLRDGQIIGNRAADGKVYVPPIEFDPDTGAAVTDFVDVATTGTVISWSWQAEPFAGQPFDRPFGWALIRLDGADSALLHAVDVESADDLRTGMRVHAVWRDERTGLVTDIAHFAPGDQAQPAPANTSTAEVDPSILITPVELSVNHTASVEETWYLEGLKQGKLLGAKTEDGTVYFPPRATSPADGSPTVERVELPDTGTVTTFCIVNVPFLGQQIKPPYVAAYVLLDGADIPFLHLILDCEASEVRMGMRIKAVWRDKSEWDHTLRNISHFRPSGEPDADYETYRSHL